MVSIIKLIKRKIKSIICTPKILISMETLTSLFIKNSISILSVHYFKNGFNEKVIKNNINFLKKHCNVISLNQALHMIENKLKIPKNTVVIVVDDVTKFFYNNVCPFLIDAGLPFTVSVIPGLIKCENREYYISRLMRIAGHEFYLSNEEMINRISSRFQTYGVNTVNSFEQIFDEVINLPNEILLELIDYMKIPDDEFASWNDLKQLKNYNQVEFACHTMGHPYLKFARGKWLEWEVGRSKKLLEQELNINIESLVIPYGSSENFTNELKDCLKKYKYKYSVLTDNGTVSYNSDLYMIPRLNGDVKENAFKFYCCPGLSTLYFSKFGHASITKRADF